MNPAKKSFLLLVFGLNFLSWFFPIGEVAALFGFISIWAVLGKKWAIAITLFAFIPGIIQMVITYHSGFSSSFASILHATKACSNSNSALYQSCINHSLNLTTGPLHYLNTSMPKAPPLPKFTSPIPATIIFFSLWAACSFFVLRRLYRIKERIRKSVGNLYGWRK